jgi:hypothetical protein
MSAQVLLAARALRRAAGVRAALGAVAVVLAAALATACTAEPPIPVAGADPSDPRARVPATTYRSTVAPYESLRPVEPAPWTQQNQQVAPQPKR